MIRYISGMSYFLHLVNVFTTRIYVSKAVEFEKAQIEELIKSSSMDDVSKSIALLNNQEADSYFIEYDNGVIVKAFVPINYAVVVCILSNN